MPNPVMPPNVTPRTFMNRPSDCFYATWPMSERAGSPRLWA